MPEDRIVTQYDGSSYDRGIEQHTRRMQKLSTIEQENVKAKQQLLAATNQLDEKQERRLNNLRKALATEAAAVEVEQRNLRITALERKRANDQLRYSIVLYQQQKQAKLEAARAGQFATSYAGTHTDQGRLALSTIDERAALVDAQNQLGKFVQQHRIAREDIVRVWNDIGNVAYSYDARLGGLQKRMLAVQQAQSQLGQTARLAAAEQEAAAQRVIRAKAIEHGLHKVEQRQQRITEIERKRESGQLRYQIHLYKQKQQAALAAGNAAVHSTRRMTQGLSRAERRLHILHLSWQSMARLIAVQIVHRAISQMITKIYEGNRAAYELQLGISEIRTLSQETQLSFERWKTGLLDLSTAFGFDVLDTAEAAYQALSNQLVQGAETFDLVRSASKLAIATLSSQADAVTVLSGVMNAYNIEVERADEVSAKLFQTVKEARTRLTDLKDFGDVAALAHQLNVELDTLLAMFQTITINALNPRRTLTQLRGVFVKMIKPTEDMNKLLRDFGFDSSEAAIKALGLPNVLKLIFERSKDLQDLALFQPRARGISGLAILRDDFERLVENIGNTEKGLEEFYKAVGIGFESNAKQVQIIGKEIERTFIEGLGEQSLEAVVAINENVGNIADSIGEVLRPIENWLNFITLVAKKYDRIDQTSRRISEWNTNFEVGGFDLINTPIGRGREIVQFLSNELFYRDQPHLEAQRAYIDFLRSQEEETDKFAQALRIKYDKLYQDIAESTKDMTRTVNLAVARINGANAESLDRVLETYEDNADGINDVFDTIADSISDNISKINDKVKESEKIAEDVVKQIKALDERFVEDQFRSALGDAETPEETARIYGIRAKQLATIRDDDSKTFEERFAANEKLYELIKEYSDYQKDASETNTKNAEKRAELEKKAADARSETEKKVHELRGKISKLDERDDVDKIRDLRSQIIEEQRSYEETIKGLKEEYDELKDIEAVHSDIKRHLAEQRDIGKEIQRDRSNKATLDKFEAEIDQYLIDERKTRLEEIKDRFSEDITKTLEEGTLEEVDKALQKRAEDLRAAAALFREEGQIEEAQNIAAQIAQLDDIIAERRKAKHAGDEQEKFNLEVEYQERTRELIRDRITFLDEEIRDFRNRIEEAEEAGRLGLDKGGGLRAQIPGLEEAIKNMQGQSEQLTRLQSDVLAAQAEIQERFERSSEVAERVQQSSFKSQEEIIESAKNIMKSVEKAVKSAEFIYRNAPDPENRAFGGLIHGTDTVPAMLTPGEFVVNARASRKFYSQLQAMNSPMNFASGGLVPGTTVNGDFNISVNSSGHPRVDAVTIGKELRREIRRGRVTLN